MSYLIAYLIAYKLELYMNVRVMVVLESV